MCSSSAAEGVPSVPMTREKSGSSRLSDVRIAVRARLSACLAAGERKCSSRWASARSTASCTALEAVGEALDSASLR